MRRFIRLAANWLEPLLDFLYPARCLHCDEPIHATDDLCPRCLADLLPFPLDSATSALHLRTMMAGEAASMAAVGYEFEPEGAMASCLHAMKYQGLTRIGEWLGRLLGERLRGTAFLDGDPVLLPVPLHPLKKRERGYNQASFLCRGLSAELGIPVRERLLERVRYTDSQSANLLGRQDRRGNVLNAFRVPAESAAHLHLHPVLLVDDVITTGATMNACATVLRERGCPEVRYLAIARPSTRSMTGGTISHAPVSGRQVSPVDSV